MKDDVYQSTPHIDQHDMHIIHTCLKFPSCGMQLYAGSGTPQTLLGDVGDYYFRCDIPLKNKQHLYFKDKTGWIGLV